MCVCVCVSVSLPYHCYQYRGLNVAPQFIFNSIENVASTEGTLSTLSIGVTTVLNEKTKETKVTPEELDLNQTTFKWKMNEKRFLNQDHRDTTEELNEYSKVFALPDIVCFTEVCFFFS